MLAFRAGDAEKGGVCVGPKLPGGVGTRGAGDTQMGGVKEKRKASSSEVSLHVSLKKGEWGGFWSHTTTPGNKVVWKIQYYERDS